MFLLKINKNIKRFNSCGSSRHLRVGTYMYTQYRSLHEWNLLDWRFGHSSVVTGWTQWDTLEGGYAVGLLYGGVYAFRACTCNLRWQLVHCRNVQAGVSRTIVQHVVTPGVDVWPQWVRNSFELCRIILSTIFTYTALWHDLDQSRKHHTWI